MIQIAQRRVFVKAVQEFIKVPLPSEDQIFNLLNALGLVLTDMNGGNKVVVIPETIDDLTSFRQAVNEALIASCLPAIGEDESADVALARLIKWEVQVALDPAVSTAAQDLIEQGRQKAIYQRGFVAGVLSGLASIVRTQNGNLHKDITELLGRADEALVMLSPESQ